MVHWIWVVAAFIAGEIAGVFIAALLTANEPKNKYIKQKKKGEWL